MDKVLSARVDEAVVRQIGLLAHQLRTSRKRILEGAVRLYAQSLSSNRDFDVLDHTFGAWRRSEKPAETVAAARRVFQQGMRRHHT
jgi:hypothetical protein